MKWLKIIWEVLKFSYKSRHHISDAAAGIVDEAPMPLTHADVEHQQQQQRAATRSKAHD